MNIKPTDNTLNLTADTLNNVEGNINRTAYVEVYVDQWQKPTELDQGCPILAHVIRFKALFMDSS